MGYSIFLQYGEDIQLATQSVIVAYKAFDTIRYDFGDKYL